MLELANIKAGDVVAVHYHGDLSSAKVAKVTATQVILENGTRYRSNGTEITSDKWHRSVIEIMTEQHRQEIKRKRNILTLNNMRWEKVDADVLEQVMVLLKPGK